VSSFSLALAIILFYLWSLASAYECCSTCRHAFDRHVIRLIGCARATLGDFLPALILSPSLYTIEMDNSWDQHKDVIRTLYLSKDRKIGTLRSIMAHMASKHDFVRRYAPEAASLSTAS
jgi:hypothetical protein